MSAIPVDFLLLGMLQCLRRFTINEPIMILTTILRVLISIRGMEDMQDIYNNNLSDFNWFEP